MLRKNKKFLPKALNLDLRNIALSSSMTAVFLLLCSCTSSQLQTSLPETVDDGRHLEAPALPDPEITPEVADIGPVKLPPPPP